MPHHKLHRKTGYFITLEGDDGVGKSTQLSRISDILHTQHIEHIVTREPGGTDLGESLRPLSLNAQALPLTQALLMMAGRWEHWKKVIRPNLEKGFWVICDRYMDSTIAYQGFGQEVGVYTLDTLHNLLFHQEPNQGLPHKTFWLDMPTEEASFRRDQRTSLKKISKIQESHLQKWLTDMSDEPITSQDPMEPLSFDALGFDFHERVRRGFAYCCMRYPNRIIRINALMKSHEVTALLEDALSQLLVQWKKDHFSYQGS